MIWLAAGVAAVVAVGGYFLIDFGSAAPEGGSASDGAQIAFFSRRTGSAEIYTIDSSGNNLRKLTTTQGHSTSPDWSADGEWLAYLFVGESPDQDGLYIVSASGEQGPKVSASASAASTPSWLPDGDGLVFGCGSDICIADVNTPAEAPRVLLSDALESDASGAVAVSPDGERLAFAREGDLYVADIGGTTEQRLTFDGQLNFKPRWSPDGERILFTSARTGSGEIYVMRTDGSDVTQLTFEGGVLGDWSPDGSMVVYQCPGPFSFDICVMNDDGSEKRFLTEDTSDDFNPNWAPQ